MAEYVWGPDESHYEDHRYIITAHVLRPSGMAEDGPLAYALDDQYMTLRKYNVGQDDKSIDILLTEKTEILARLRRAKAERDRQSRTPH